MRRRITALFLFSLVFYSLLGFLLVFSSQVVYSDELDEQLEEVEEEIEETQEEYEEVEGELKKLRNQAAEVQGELNRLSGELSLRQADLDQVGAKITAVETLLAEIVRHLEIKRKELAIKEAIRNRTVRDLYKRTRVSELDFWLSSGEVTDLARTMGYYKGYLGKTRQIIRGVNSEIGQFEKDQAEAEGIKVDLESQKVQLVALRDKVASQAAEVQGELDQISSQSSALENELASLSNALSELSAKQRDILRAKFDASSERLTVGDYEESAQVLPEPPSSPAYAFFSRGYPHRVGMNQYGARGRAEDGQDYKEILEAYYGDDIKIEGDCDDDKKIPVEGYGNLKLEEYLYGLGEMPSSWPMEALKAQAVAARSYALNYVDYYWSDGKVWERSSSRAICTTQACQVYLGHSKGGRWEEAVDGTCGKVITYDGKPITAWYASTAGGYTRSSSQVWGGSRPWAKGIRDGKCNDWEGCSYDGPNYGNSPWFHRAWGEGRHDGPWLTEEEAEDIFNTYLLVEENDSYTEDLSPIDRGGMSMGEVKDKLEDGDIDPVGEIEKIEVYNDGEGYTTKVRIYSENYDGKDFDGYQFRSIFNLRSPGTLVIWTSFFDVLRED